MNRPKTPVQPPPAFVIQRKGIVARPAGLIQAKVATKGLTQPGIQGEVPVKSPNVKLAVNVPPVFQPSRSISVAQRKSTVGSLMPKPNTPPIVRPAVWKTPSNVVQCASSTVTTTKSKSGRSPEQIWDLFLRYAKTQAENVVDEFIKKTDKPMMLALKDILKAIKETGADLPAHGTGDSTSEMHPEMEKAIPAFAEKLLNWLNQSAMKETKRTSSALKHSDEQKEEVALLKAQQEMEKAKKKHLAWHGQNPQVPVGKHCKECKPFL